MKLEFVMKQLESIRLNAEENELSELIKIQIIGCLVDYIGNEKIREAVNEIPF